MSVTMNAGAISSDQRGSSTVLISTPALSWTTTVSNESFLLPARRRRCCQWSPFIMSCYCLYLLLSFVDAAVYIQEESYASLPGLFGMAMSNDKLYEGRLQFLRENPYLCDDFDNTTTTFVRPSDAIISTLDGNLTGLEPIVLLAARGNCPFQRKAYVAERMDSMVKYLIVYNYNLDGEDTLVPMYSEIGDTRLGLLSVTHRTGQALKQILAAQPEAIARSGGPLIRFDTTPPDVLLTVQDLRNMLLSALGLFFMLISLSGCIMIVAGTYGQMHGSRIVFTTNGTPVVLAGNSGLLTEEQVRHLTNVQSVSENNDAVVLSSSSSHPEDLTCAVCIDDLASSGGSVSVTVLPCQHKFHTDCIVPWLTERQSKCPLCKFDLLQHVRDKEAAAVASGDYAPTSRAVVPTLLNRFLRYHRWTRVLGVEHDETNTNNVDTTTIAASDERNGAGHDGENNGLELTEQHQQEQSHEERQSTVPTGQPGLAETSTRTASSSITARSMLHADW